MNLGQAPAQPPQAGVAPGPQAPQMQGDAKQVRDGAAAIAQAAGPQAPQRFALAAAQVPPQPPKTGSTAEQIEAWTRYQRSLVDAMRNQVQQVGFQEDPNKIGLGLSPAQRVYANLSGVFIGAEDDVKKSAAYSELNRLFMSMPSNPTPDEMARLMNLEGSLAQFNQNVAQINGLRVQITTARAADKKDEVKRLEEQVKSFTAAQQNIVNGLKDRVKALGFREDPNKTNIGLSPAQRVYANLSGVFIGAEDDVKKSAAFSELNRLYASMPSNPTNEELGRLMSLEGQLAQFNQNVQQINGLRVQITTAKAAGNKDEVKRLEDQVKSFTSAQQNIVNGLRDRAKGLGFREDPSKIGIGLSPAQRVYSGLSGVFIGSEEDVKKSAAYSELNRLFSSMPNNPNPDEMAKLMSLEGPLAQFNQNAAQINGLRVQITAAKAADNKDEVKRLEEQVKSFTSAQQNIVNGLRDRVKSLGFREDPSKIGIGLSPSQRVYSGMSGVFIGAEEDVKKSAAFAELNRLYASMPSNPTPDEMQRLMSLEGTIAQFNQNAQAINVARVQVTAAKAAGNKDEVKRLEEQIKGLTTAQQNIVNGLRDRVKSLGFREDPNKIGIGLSPAQRVYSGMSGVFIGSEEDVKKSEAFGELNRLYASMPSNPSPEDMAKLMSLEGQLAQFNQNAAQINALRVQITAAKAADNKDEVKRLEGQVKSFTSAQQNIVNGLRDRVKSLGFREDPSKIGIGLTEGQRLYSRLTGVFTGAEDEVRKSPEFAALHRLYMSMPSNPSDADLAKLRTLNSLLDKFEQSIKEINGLQIQRVKEKAEGK